MSAIRRGSRALLENVIMNRVYRPECFGCDLRIWDTDAEFFFHANDEFKRVDGIESQATRPEERQVVADLIRSGLQHQVLHQHFFDLGAKIGLGHSVM
jgi:hypothetical protein